MSEASPGHMNDDIDNRRDGSFDKSLSENDEPSDDETVEI